MPKIRFIEYDGTEHVVDAEIGQSVQDAALKHSVPGIIADCGGYCSCATCHAYIEGVWKDRLNPPLENEKIMIENALDINENSRLTCQIEMTEALDGLVVSLPKSQI